MQITNDITLKFKPIDLARISYLKGKFFNYKASLKKFLEIGQHINELQEKLLPIISQLSRLTELIPEQNSFDSSSSNTIVSFENSENIHNQELRSKGIIENIKALLPEISNFNELFTSPNELDEQENLLEEKLLESIKSLNIMIGSANPFTNADKPELNNLFDLNEMIRSTLNADFFKIIDDEEEDDLDGEEEEDDLDDEEDCEIENSEMISFSEKIFSTISPILVLLFNVFNENDKKPRIKSTLQTNKALSNSINNYEDSLREIRNLRAAISTSTNKIQTMYQLMISFNKLLKAMQDYSYLIHNNISNDSILLQSAKDDTFQDKDIQVAQQSFQQAMEYYRQAGDHLEEANCYRALGRIAIFIEDYHNALTLYTNSYQLYQQIQDDYKQAEVLYDRAIVYEALNQMQFAIQDINTALTIALTLNFPFVDLLRQRLNDLQN